MRKQDIVFELSITDVELIVAYAYVRIVGFWNTEKDADYRAGKCSLYDIASFEVANIMMCRPSGLDPCKCLYIYRMSSGAEWVKQINERALQVVEEKIGQPHPLREMDMKTPYDTMYGGKNNDYE